MNNLWRVAAVHFVLLEKAIMKGWNAFYIETLRQWALKTFSSAVLIVSGWPEITYIVIKCIFQVTAVQG